MTRTTSERRRALLSWPNVPNKIGSLVRFERASATFYICAVVIVGSLILGGGTRGGLLSDAILQLLAIPLLLWALWKIFDRSLPKQTRSALWFCLALAALPLSQLVPLPPWLWTALPHRQPSAETFGILGQAIPWMPVSVSPQSTWLSALSIIPPLAIFLGTLLLTYRERRWLSLVVIAVGILSVFLGLVQVAQGQESGWRFFKITNPTDAVGFFANRNHFAALIYCLILFAAPWMMYAVGRIRSGNDGVQYDVGAIVVSLGVFIIFIVLLAGALMTRSRAGLGLTIVGLIGCIALAFSDRRPGFSFTPAKMVLGAIVVALALSSQFALYRILERFTLDLIQDDRSVYAQNTIEAARAYMPVGSGLGTFIPVYAMFEKPDDVAVNYVNRAHNDALELWLETGVVGIALIGLFLVWLIRRALDIWRHSPAGGMSEVDLSLARAATLVVTLVLVHSLFDYPLRTGAITAIVAFASALLIAPLVSDEPKREEPEAFRERRRHSDKRRQAIGSVPSPALPPSHPEPVASHSRPRRQSWGTDVQWPKEWIKASNPRDRSKP